MGLKHSQIYEASNEEDEYEANSDCIDNLENSKELTHQDLNTKSHRKRSKTEHEFEDSFEEEEKKIEMIEQSRKQVQS